MSELQILFCDHDGIPVPLRPGVPDGTTMLSLAEAQQRFGRTEQWLRSLYQAFFSQFGAPPDSGDLAPVTTASPFTPASLDALWRMKFPSLSREQFLDVYEECRQRKLNPWCNHVVVKLEHDHSIKLPRPRVLVTIQGLRALARGTDHFRGRKGPFWRGPGQKWMRHWDDENQPPAMSRVGIFREGDIAPTWGIARWRSHAAYVLDQSGQTVLDPYWQKMGPFMLAKCAEADGLRAAFPELGGLYVPEEMMQADNPPACGAKSSAPPSGRHLVDDQGNEIDETMRPRTRFEFEQSLQKLGIHDPDARLRIVERYRARAGDMCDSDPRGFYELVLNHLRRDMSRYHTGGIDPTGTH